MPIPQPDAKSLPPPSPRPLPRPIAWFVVPIYGLGMKVKDGKATEEISFDVNACEVIHRKHLPGLDELYRAHRDCSEDSNANTTA